MLIAGGPMSGQRFVADIDFWPPPPRLIGGDIHPSLLGTYELDEATDGLTICMARYCLREDADYERLVRNRMTMEGKNEQT